MAGGEGGPSAGVNHKAQQKAAPEAVKLPTFSELLRSLEPKPTPALRAPDTQWEDRRGRAWSRDPFEQPSQKYLAPAQAKRW